MPELGVEAVRKVGGKMPGGRAVQGGGHPDRGVQQGQRADADGLASEELELGEVLEAGRQRLPPGLDLEAAQVDGVDQDGPLGRLVEADQELGQSGLAGTVLADDGYRRAGR